MFKAPPAMRENLSYEDWKKELSIWCKFTDLSLTRQAGAIFLALQGKARETVLAEVPDAKYDTDQGVTAILAALDGLYLKDKCESGFEAFDDFIKFRRPRDMSITDYLIEFNLRYNKIKCHEMKLPEGVLAYALLTCSNLPDEQSQICRATVSKLTFQDMKTQIEKVSMSIDSAAKTNKYKYDTVPVETYYAEPFSSRHRPEVIHDGAQHYSEPYVYSKSQLADEDAYEYADFEEQECEYEDTYYLQRSQPSRRFQSAGYEVGRGGYETARPRTRVNVLDEFGNPQTCRFCKSIYHFLDDCPDAPRHFSRPGRGMTTRGYSRGRGRGGGRGYNNRPGKSF